MSLCLADLVTLGAAFSTGWRACRQYHSAVEGAHYTSIPSYSYAMRSSAPVTVSCLTDMRSRCTEYDTAFIGLPRMLQRTDRFGRRLSSSLNCSHLNNQDSRCICY
ncbi:uncharacterized protein BJ212DRAFT_519735 [Suillus subaureus]|uniref:Secreted protein n=1 Tax=Suillus subaureus TaxID=48587 RepID=A0A9P7EKS1_9AGAM|nr:uncharacterized protein BJ212DRAFT_519735 [Suillus subaureus]KAG1824327.1 hypothetical protein BJ212DRAFT_519735 [Suillus subaureus]